MFERFMNIYKVNANKSSRRLDNPTFYLIRFEAFLDF